MGFMAYHKLLKVYSNTLFCFSSGMATLQEIQLSTTRQNAFAGVALEKLLDNNLSAKYALTGRLSKWADERVDVFSGNFRTRGCGLLVNLGQIYVKITLQYPFIVVSQFSLEPLCKSFKWSKIQVIFVLIDMPSCLNRYGLSSLNRLFYASVLKVGRFFLYS